MFVNCHEVWREISNYIDDDLDPSLRSDIEVHLAQCRHCAALLDSTRNVIVLIADARVFQLPTGFSQRLRARLLEEIGRKA